MVLCVKIKGECGFDSRCPLKNGLRSLASYAKGAIMEMLVLIVGLVCAFIGVKMSGERGRSKPAGFILGLFLGIIGLAIIALMGKTNV